jgi:very-short-patch-repair endonuclease
LIVEIDGRTYHAKREAFTHDRRRDRRLALAGFETRRYAASEIVDEPAKVIAEVGAFLRLTT